MSVARFVKMGPNRRLEVRIDTFNTFNTFTITGVNNILQVRSLTDPTPTNLSGDASGNLINATGFGAVTAVAPARQIQLMARFHFSSGPPAQRGPRPAIVHLRAAKLGSLRHVSGSQGCQAGLCARPA